MLELFLSLLGKVSQLLELRSKRRRNVFNDLIRPTHEKLSRIHEDYVKSFEKLRAKAVALDRSIAKITKQEREEYGVRGLRDVRRFYLERNREELSSLHELIRSQRVYVELVRSELKTSMKIYIKRISYHEERMYLEAVEAYFPTSGNENQKESRSLIGSFTKTVHSSILTDFRAIEATVRLARQVVRERLSILRQSPASSEINLANAQPDDILFATALDGTSIDNPEEMSLTRILGNFDRQGVSVDITGEIDLIIRNRRRRWKIICDRYAEVHAKYLSLE